MSRTRPPKAVRSILYIHWKLRYYPSNNPMNFLATNVTKKLDHNNKVSVDWLMGVSNEPEIDGLVLEKLTYEQIAKVFDRLIDNNTIEIPNLVDVASENGLMAEPSEDGEPQEKDPIFDSDYIKVKDRLLAYIMRRRLRLKEIDLEMLDTWRDKLGNFQGLRLLTYNDLLENAIDAHSPAQFKDGDWVELVNRLSKLTTDELQELVSQLKKKEGTN